MYMNKLDKIMVRENGKAEYHLFKDKGELYYAYIKVPSEVIENFYYDVIIEFRQPDKDKKIHKAKYLGGGNFVYKTTIKDVFDYIKVLLPFLK